jgi:sensor c-di-GMP phosphodiesterase-like protein
VIPLATNVPAGAGMNLSILWVALIAIFTSITAPLLLAYVNNRAQRRAKLEDAAEMRAAKAEDYARQDRVAAEARKVAEKAADAAELLAKRQATIAAAADQTARLLLANQQATTAAADEVARLAAMNAEKSDAKLDQIHTLVNSQLTAVRQAELDQARAMLVVLKRVTALAALRGEHADPLDLTAIERTEGRIAELEAILADRLQQLRAVEAEAAEHPVPGAEPGRPPAP